MHRHDYLLAPGDIPIATDRLYHRDHYWILVNLPQPGHCRIGLSAYVCRLGIEVYFVDHLALPGTEVPEGGLLGVIETEKAVVSIYSPALCRVTAINHAVLEDPNRLSFANYRVWLLEVQMFNRVHLLSPQEYVQYLQTLPPPQCFPAEPKSK